MRKKVAEVYESDAIERACMLVGRFFFEWALLESKINTIIKTLFELQPIEGDIMLANINLRDKIHILQTILTWQGKIHDDQWQTSVKKAIGRLVRLNTHRNVLAHNAFCPLADKSVKFFKTAARGQFSYPLVVWREADFFKRYCLIDGLHDELERLTASLRNRRAIIDALSRAPTAGTGWLGIPTPPFLLAQALRNFPSESATPKTEPQTSPSPEKEPQNGK